MAARRYEVSPGPAALVTRSDMTAKDNLEVSNGRASPNGPAALSNPEALPDAAEGAASPSTGGRACSECGEPLPAESRRERVVCSPRCRQLRHDRLRKSKVRPQVEQPRLATGPAPPAVEPPVRPRRPCSVATSQACLTRWCA